MAYFKLKLPERINSYGFDYHSHFTGILPVRGKHASDQRPSMERLVAAAACDGNEDRAALLLFDYALAFMANPATNPFVQLAASANPARYERAECAGENVYLACIVLLDAYGHPDESTFALPITSPQLYLAARQMVIAPALDGDRVAARDLLRTIRYFNGKIYSSNKYTPFDDCYKMRGAFVRQFCGGDPADYPHWDQQGPGVQRYHAWIDATLDYLRQSHVMNTQAATTEDEVAALDARMSAYNRTHDCSYKLLVHTPHQYMPDGKLQAYLQTKLLPLLTGETYPQVIGIDLLGAENKVGNYRELFEFLDANAAAFAGNFGENGSRSRRLVTHIHCGEGSGFGADHRSLTGYCIYRSGVPDKPYYRRLSHYVRACAKAARDRFADTPRGTRGTATPWGLFDALFAGGGSLSHRGLLLRRFDISAQGVREQSSYNAKRNVMALAEAFDARPGDSQRSWYDTLVATGSPFAFRLGHAYHYRGYMAARYPAIAFDTNLGSNAITGASGLFASVESYRINRGFRHLNGYIDTGVLQAAGDAIAYMGSEALTQAQIAEFARISTMPGDIDTVLENADVRRWISDQLAGALDGLQGDDRPSYLIYQNLVAYVAGDAAPGPQRYQALTRTFTLFQNWRCYLLGADGQGAEHTEVQDEFLRMLILLAYALLPTGVTDVEEPLLRTLANFVDRIAYAYWSNTVDQPALPSPAQQPLRLESIDGFKAPLSVVALYREPVAQAQGN